MSRRDKASGRSIEEVILRRKLGEEHIGFPQTHSHTHSQSLPQLASARNTPTQRKTPLSQAHTRTHMLTHAHTPQEARYSDEDVRRMTEEVSQYARSLQRRVQELETQLVFLSHTHGNTSGDHTVNMNNNNNNKLQPLAVSAAGFAGLFSAQSPLTHAHTRTQTQSFSRSAGGLLSTDSHTSDSPHDHTTTQAHNAHSAAGSSRGGSRLRPLTQPHTNTHAQSSSSSASTLSQEKQTISDIDTKLSTLRGIFRRNDPLQERRDSAVKIQSAIRGFLARCRYTHARQAAREWRYTRTRPVLWLIDLLLSHQSKFDAAYHLFVMNRTMKKLNLFFSKWASVFRANAPMRRAMRTAAKERIAQCERRFLKRAFDGLKTATVGKASKKEANRARRALLERLRGEISFAQRMKGMSGVVAEDVLMKALHHAVVDEFKVRKRAIVLFHKFNALKRAVAKRKEFERIAVKHRFVSLAGKCFYAWSDHTYLKSVGLDRKRWPGPRKYEVRYNQKRVDHFSRFRCKRMIFRAWKAYFSIQFRVKRSYQRKLTQFLQSVVTAWREVAVRCRRLRKEAYETWAGYARFMVTEPFQAWAEYVRGVKNKFNEHSRIAKSYRRWKTRQRLAEIVKRWRHLALFGRLDGLYSRQMLVRSLGEQKIFTHTLEKALSDQTIELEECRQMVQNETEKRKERESTITTLTHEISQQKMTLHNYEQELTRLHSLVESVAKINPKQVAHIQRLQPDFEFKERDIALPGDKRKKNSSEKKKKKKSGDSEEDDEENEGESGEESEAEEEMNNSINNGNKRESSLRGIAEEDERESEAEKEKKKETDSFSEKVRLRESEDSLSLSSNKREIQTQAQTHVPKVCVSVETQTDEALSLLPSAGVDLGSADTKAILVSVDDERLLERAKWLVERYRRSQKESEREEDESEEEEEDAHAQDADANGSLHDKDNAVDEEDEDGESDENDEEDDEEEEEENEDGSVSMKRKKKKNKGDAQKDENASPPVKKRIKNDLLRHANPFVKRKSDKQGSAPSSPFIGEREIPLPGISLSRTPSNLGIKSPFRASFSRSQNTVAGSAPHTAHSLASTSGEILAASETLFYSNEELEDTVITWAKMLFTFLEFLYCGDVTNLPAEDKRLWVENLLESAAPANTVPSLAEWDSLSHSSSVTRTDLKDGETENSSIESALYSALVTVDQRMHGGVSWGAALLRLRTMFPAAGNFSGFGQGAEAENARESGLFKRLLRMHDDLKAVEEVQTRRYQRQFIASRRQAKPRRGKQQRETAGHVETHFPSRPVTSHAADGERDRESEEEREEDGDWPPLGLNIYAGNLKLLRESSGAEPLLPQTVTATATATATSKKGKPIQFNDEDDDRDD